MKMTPEQQTEALQQLLAARQAAAKLFEQIDLLENPPPRRLNISWQWVVAGLLLVGNLVWCWYKTKN